MSHVVRGLVLLLVLLVTACGEDGQGSNVDPDQVDAVETPELGACRLLTPDDVALPTNATETVDCSERHNAETYAVGQPADRRSTKRRTTTARSVPSPTTGAARSS